MILQYGDVIFDELVIQRWEHDDILDGPNYLYTRHRIAIRGTVNPAILSAIVGPKMKAGQKPAETIKAIRQYLMQPRRTLLFLVGPSVMLTSPPAGQVCDAEDGPKPVSCTIVEAHGFRTMFVDFVIETKLNECGTQRAILSQLWEMQHDVDQDGFTTRHIKGRAVFNKGALLKLAATPDDFRLALFHPIPSGFKRIQVRTTVSPDGDTLTYELFDRERYLNFLGREIGVSRVGGFHEYINGRRGSGFGSTKELEDFRRRVARGANTISSAPRFVGGVIAGLPFGGVGAGFIGGVLAGQYFTEQKLIDMESSWREYPKGIHHLVVEVWGNNRALRTDLTLFANRIMVGRLGAIQDPMHDITYRLWHELAEGHIILEVSLTTPPIRNGDGGPGGRLTLQDGQLIPEPFANFNQDPGALVKIDPIDLGHPGHEFTRDADGRARGTYKEQVVAAAFLGPCEAVPIPAAVPTAVNNRNLQD